MIAALYVEPGGPYFGLPGVDPWDQARDARMYAGPHPVVAHPPCKRWGKFWHGSPLKPHQFKLGDDGLCFYMALEAVRAWGGVLEHPAHSHAWRIFGINRPRAGAGWIVADDRGGFTCEVEQGHYGHISRKPTWLYANGVALPNLDWSKGPRKMAPQWYIEKHGYVKARRQGIMGMSGGRNSDKLRSATPPRFRDILIGMASNGI